jgi:hypothetical protein
MALPPKSLGTGRHVMAAPILDQGGEVAYMATGHQFDLPYSDALRDGRKRGQFDERRGAPSRPSGDQFGWLGTTSPRGANTYWPGRDVIGARTSVSPR